LRNKPDADNRELVEQRIAELEKLIDEEERSRQKPPQGTQEPGHGLRAERAEPVNENETPEERIYCSAPSLAAGASVASA
jgi:hypothetical protein